MVNTKTIQKNFNLFKTRLTTVGIEDTPLPQMVEEKPEEPVQGPVERQSPQNTITVTIEPETRTQAPVPERPEVQTTPAPSTTQQQPGPQTPAQTRDRNIYFTQIDRDGQILHSRVTRRIPVSDSPMQDVLNTLLIGPTADELNRGLLNLIPQNTRILTATVRGSTAYISFSEDFLFNTFGVEGYVAQLRQVVWTVTEFSNVSDVQILVEGRRLDYLGEGIWIGSPISRQSF
jgi:spore germination protein GerM